MNKTGMKILSFVLVVVGIFVFIGNTIPGSDKDSRPPTALTQETFAALGPEALLATGRQLFGSAGDRCSQCHMISGPKGRGPNIGGVGARAAGRKKGLSAEQYIMESLIEPKAFVVDGFSPIMPEVYKSPLDLSEYDILAVVAYLQSLGGKVTIDKNSHLKPEWSQKIAAAQKAGGSKPPRGSIAHGKKLFYQEMRCVACHQTVVKGQTVGGRLGPELSAIGLIQGPDYLRESIVDPASVVVSPYTNVMPKHFKENLSDQDVNDLIVFLLSLREAS